MVHIFHTLYLANVNNYAEERLDFFLCGNYEFLCWIYGLTGASGKQMYTTMTDTC